MFSCLPPVSAGIFTSLNFYIAKRCTLSFVCQFEGMRKGSLVASACARSSCVGNRKAPHTVIWDLKTIAKILENSRRKFLKASKFIIFHDEFIFMFNYATLFTCLIKFWRGSFGYSRNYDILSNVGFLLILRYFSPID